MIKIAPCALCAGQREVGIAMHAPTAYKARYERELHRRQNLERRVEALTLERDALKCACMWRKGGC